MIYFNNNEISEVYVGNEKMASGWTDGSYIFPTSEPPTPPTPIVDDFLQFTAVDGDATISMSGSASVNVAYSFDRYTWRNLETPYSHSTVTVPNGRTVYISGNNTNGFSTSTSSYKKFNITGTVEANGNIQSLLYGRTFDNLTIPSNYCLYNLFFNCTGLTTPPQLPATTLTKYCYSNMFRACTNLTYAPTLPATIMEEDCYYSMFFGCRSLTASPELPSINLANGCYAFMFDSCTSLTSAPQLPATTLKSNCYGYMFEDCTSLTTAPVLPAETLSDYCYQWMFNRCTNLNYIKMMATDISDIYCLDDWTRNVASNGTFVKNINATWDVRGDDGVPNNWTIQYE